MRDATKRNGEEANGKVTNGALAPARPTACGSLRDLHARIVELKSQLSELDLARALAEVQVKHFAGLWREALLKELRQVTRDILAELAARKVRAKEPCTVELVVGDWQLTVTLTPRDP